MHIEKAKFTKEINDNVIRQAETMPFISREISLEKIDSEVMQCYITACNIVKMYGFPNSFYLHEANCFACWVFIGISDNGHVFAWFIEDPIIKVTHPNIEHVSFTMIDKFYNPTMLRPQLIDFTEDDIDHVDIQTSPAYLDQTNIVSRRYFQGVRVFDIVYSGHRYEKQHNFFEIHGKPNTFQYVIPFTSQ